MSLIRITGYGGIRIFNIPEPVSMEDIKTLKEYYKKETRFVPDKGSQELTFNGLTSESLINWINTGKLL